MDSARQDKPTPNGGTGGNTKHNGAHSHLRIIATATARIRISPAQILSNFAVAPVFSTGVLRI